MGQSAYKNKMKWRTVTRGACKPDPGSKGLPSVLPASMAAFRPSSLSNLSSMKHTDDIPGGPGQRLRSLNFIGAPEGGLHFIQFASRSSAWLSTPLPETAVSRPSILRYAVVADDHAQQQRIFSSSGYSSAPAASLTSATPVTRCPRRRPSYRNICSHCPGSRSSQPPCLSCRMMPASSRSSSR